MKKLLAGLGWAALFASAGALLAVGAGLATHHPVPRRALLLLGGIGAECGLNLWLLALIFARLPGVRRHPGTTPPFGAWQGIWSMAGTMLAMGAGSLVPVNLGLAVFLGRTLWGTHHPPRPDMHAPLVLASIVLAGELMAALWLAWQVRRLGPGVLRTGIGWRAAPWRAYVMAGLLCLCLLGLVGITVHLVPPHVQALRDLPLARLADGPPLARAAVLLLALVLAPALEEVCFRGAGFGGLAARLGPIWATLITSALFVALHAPEKLHYPPGFIDVGVLALANCWLRVRYGSIRPGIWLHVGYNALAGFLL